MSTVAEIVRRTPIGQMNSIASAGTTPQALEIFKTVIDEAQRLHEQGKIEIVHKQLDRIRFMRLQ